MVRNVFKEEDGSFNFFNDAKYVGPEVSFVIFRLLFSGTAKWLTWISSSKDMNFATPRIAVEGFDVGPHRRHMKLPFLHSLDKTRGGISFPFHPTDSLVGVAVQERESKFDSADSGTKSHPIQDSSSM
jgi:hypothetical protein